jgi:hypothetical protein
MRRSYLSWTWVLTVLCAGCGSPAIETDGAGTDAGVLATDGGHDAGPGADGGSIDAGATDASVSSSVLVHAATGGLVRADDGLFEIYVMPGALAADTTISITRVASAMVPADVAATTPVSAVYAVEPDGLTFSGEGAYGHFVFATAPSGLVGAGPPPSYASVQVSARPTAGGAITAQPRVRARYDAPSGRLDVVARMAHFSYQWAFAGRTSLGVDFGAAMHGLGAPFAVTEVVVDAPDGILPNMLTWSTENAAVVVATGNASGSASSTSYIGSDAVTTDERAMLAAFGLADVPEPAVFRSSPPTSPSPFVGSVIPWSPADLPTFECIAPGDASLYVDLEFRLLGQPESHSVRVVAPVHCGATAEPGGQIFVGDTHRVTQSAGHLVVASTAGAAANFIRETTDLASHCSFIAGTNRLCAHVTGYTSDHGVDVATITTPNETITATFDATTQQYDITGLAAPLAAVENFNASYSDVAPAPARLDRVIIDSGWVPDGASFSNPAGLDTTLSIPDGSCDDVQVIFVLDDPTGTGETTVTTDAALDTLPLTGTTRTLTLASSALQAALTAGGLGVASARIVLMNDEIDTLMFGAAVVMAAGHVIDVDMADLMPPPVPGAVDTRACSATPHPLGQYDDGSGVLQTDFVVCIDSTGCRMSNALVCSTPNVAYNSSTPSATNSSGFALPPDWWMPWSSTGVARNATTATVGVAQSVIVERASDGVRYRFDYVPNATQTLINSILVWNGVVPPFGATDDCERLPQTYSTVLASGSLDVYARLCLQAVSAPLQPPATLCSAFGNVEASPENETCPLPYALTFAADHATSAPSATAGTGWTITNTTAGTLSGSTVTGLPVGSDVTIDVQRSSTARWHAVVQWTGTSYIVRSVTAY